ncbi:MAG TPA: GNAT family N-acetyltransferase [Patescibacteria group bacterium]|nr:GNAT family N-acetyltransferase [Patescibacteria group bacterium]
MDQVLYRLLTAGDEALVARMVVQTFLQCVAPGYSLAGIQEFMAFIAPGELRQRRVEGNRQWVALYQGIPVGFAEAREARHLALLFVALGWQGRGIGTALLERVRQYCREAEPPREILTVNSSPYAVLFYRKNGFTPFVEEQERNGVRYLPMAAPLTAL